MPDKYSNSDGELSVEIGPYVVSRLFATVNDVPRETIGILVPSIGLNFTLTEIDQGVVLSVMTMACSAAPDDKDCNAVMWSPVKSIFTKVFSPDETEITELMSEIMSPHRPLH